MNEEKLEVELERLAKLLRQLPEVEEEVDRCEEALDAARSNVEYVRSGIAEVRARVCNLLMPPNIVVAGPALTPVSEGKDEVLLADQQDTPPQSNAQESETDAALTERFDKILERAVAQVDAQDEALAKFMKRPGAVKVQPGEFIEVNRILRYWLHEDGHIETTPNPSIIWPRNAIHGSIIAYAPVEAPTADERTSVVTDHDRVDQTNTDTAAAVEIPEGFIPWESGYCPFGIGTHVEVLTRKNGVWPVVIKPEAPLLWEHEGHDLDIIAYKVISEPAKASETPSEQESSSEVGDAREEQTHNREKLSEEEWNKLDKIVDDIPTIPRAEIPPGIASETFTDTGVETVKIGGLTHIVEGEAPVDKFSAIRDGGDAGFWAAARGLTKIEEMA